MDVGVIVSVLAAFVLSALAVHGCVNDSLSSGELVAVGGFVVAIGGTRGADEGLATDVSWRLDVRAGVWTALADGPSPRDVCTVTLFVAEGCARCSLLRGVHGHAVSWVLDGCSHMGALCRTAV